MKKIVSSISLAFVLSVTSITNSYATQLDGASGWATDLLETAISRNIVPEQIQGSYTQAITRAEFCYLAVATYEEATGSEITARKTFTDSIDLNVEKMAGIGVVSGTSEITFSPDKALNREEAAVMLANLHEKLNTPLPESELSFSDTEQISSWATNAVGKVSGAGIMSGMGDNRFAPNDTYSREQSIVTLLKVFDLTKNGDTQEITSISISPDNYYLAHGESVQLAAVTNLGTTISGVTWKSSDEVNFPVDATGKVTALNDGTTMYDIGSRAKITATTEDGLSSYSFLIGTCGVVPTAVTAQGNVYGKFQEIQAFENVAPHIPLLSEYQSNSILNTGEILFLSHYYNYELFSQEDAELYAKEYVNFLKDVGFVATREEGAGYIFPETLSDTKLTSPSGKYEVNITAKTKNTDSHISGSTSVRIYYTNGTINEGYFTPGFDPDFDYSQVTQPDVSDWDLQLIRYDVIANVNQSLSGLEGVITNVSKADSSGFTQTGLLYLSNASISAASVFPYINKALEVVEPIRNVDAKYEYIYQKLLEYEQIVYKLLETDGISNLNSSNFSDHLKGLLYTVNEGLDIAEEILTSF